MAIYATTFTIYQEAHSQELAEQQASLMGNRLTQALRETHFAPEASEDVAVPVAGSTREVADQEHQTALAYEPPKEAWEHLSKGAVDFLGNA